jgi:nucleoside-diphosphate-sugar epimerase
MQILSTIVKYPPINSLASRVLGESNVFSQTMDSQSSELTSLIYGKKILISGGAGFIARQTLFEILKFSPKEIIIVDISENGLAELVRELRSTSALSGNTRLAVSLVDINSPRVFRLMSDIGKIDLFLNFAAVKHVRSERDVVSTQHLLQTNILGAFNIAQSVLASSPECIQFAVSTDKAASPANLMGASKLIMEKVLASEISSFRTARFANVAFSDGSILANWVSRLLKSQPLSLPEDTRRFFISPSDSGKLCTISMLLDPSFGSLPTIPQANSLLLQEVLEELLAFHELKPLYLSQMEFLQNEKMASLNYDVRSYPVVLQPRDTVGEKQVEVFLNSFEFSSSWLKSIDKYEVSQIDGTQTILDSLRELTNSSTITLEELIAEIEALEPTFSHIKSNQHLDDRI